MRTFFSGFKSTLLKSETLAVLYLSFVIPTHKTQQITYVILLLIVQMTFTCLEHWRRAGCRVHCAFSSLNVIGTGISVSFKMSLKSSKHPCIIRLIFKDLGLLHFWHMHYCLAVVAYFHLPVFWPLFSLVGIKFCQLTFLFASFNRFESLVWFW